MSSSVNSLTFCFWRSRRAGEPGHAGVLCSDREKDTYHAFWPTVPFWANVWTGLTTLPLRGRAVTDLEEDIAMEKRKPDVKINFSIPSEKYEEIQNYIDQTRQEIKEGRKLYCITPRYPVLLNSAKFVARIAWQSLQNDPTTELPANFPFEPEINLKKELKNFERINVGHCTTDVREILAIAADNPYIAQTNLPWSISPNKLEEIVAKIPGAEIEITIQKPPEPGSADDLCYIV